MQERSLFLSKNLYQNKEIILNELKELIKEIFKSREDVVRIILFGSILTERFGLGSDADILIILKHSKHTRFFDRIPEFLSFFNKRVSIPVDIFPYTEDEIIKMVKTENPFIKRILKEGKILYEKV